MPLIRSASFNLFIEIALRVALISAFCYMESMDPFVRVIHRTALMDDYKYPRTESYVSGTTLWTIVLAVPCIVSLIAWALLDDCNDALEFLLSWSLSLGITGVLTDMLKLMVGRPRPDFFYRCFPDGTQAPTCYGDPKEIANGRKSFPSGHSSLSFCSLSLCSYWIWGRMSCNRGAVPLVAGLAPLVLASAVAVSRTCDYHHHWQDVLVGSLLGLSVSTISYRLYYNDIRSEHHGVPLIVTECRGSTTKFDDEATPPLLRKEDKWI